jgi:RNA binding exosome subunit
MPEDRKKHLKHLEEKGRILYTSPMSLTNTLRKAAGWTGNTLQNVERLIESSRSCRKHMEQIRDDEPTLGDQFESAFDTCHMLAGVAMEEIKRVCLGRNRKA